MGPGRHQQNRRDAAAHRPRRPGLGDPVADLAPAQARRDYRVVDAGPYPAGSRGFAAQVAALRDGQRYQPKLATVAEAPLFPADVEALGPLGVNLGTEVWWSPSHPFTSSLTGQSAAQLADAYAQATGRQWTRPVGFAHALFEVAAAPAGALR